MANVVDAYLAEKYSDNEEVRDALVDLHCRYTEWNLKDNNFDQEFINGRDEQFYPRIWEMLLAQHFKDHNLNISSKEEGPDFKIEHDNQTIWVEAICPMPTGIDDDWIDGRGIRTKANVRDVPIIEMQLRFTAAIKEKMEKRNGRVRWGEEKRAEIWAPGWMAQKIIGVNDPYVIAISSNRLALGSQFSHTGISGFPFAAEVALGIGPLQISVDRVTGEKREHNTYRDSIPNANGADVPSDIFRRSEYAGISAILSSPAGINAACGGDCPIVIVHNPKAENPLPKNILGADEEIWSENSDDGYEIIRRPKGANQGC